MRQAETDLGTKLDWVAVDHFNTGHPHTHIVIRGKDELGQDLVIARDYMSHGFRERARDLVTLELGPETQIEMEQKLQREMTADRLTRIDRSLLRDAEGRILAVSRNGTGGQQWHSLRTGRLRKLQSMGLAEELKPGVWRLAERTEKVLRDLGQRNDIIKVMQRVLKEAGQERGMTEFSIFKADDPNAKVIGKIIGIGLSDEINNHHYVVVDGTDGKLHYANIGQLNSFDPPANGLLVTLKGQQQSPNGINRLTQQAQLFIESHASFEQLATTNGATWLDRKLVLEGLGKLASRGFGAEVQKALHQRQRWLVREGLATEQQGQFVIKRQLLAELTKRNIEIAEATLEKKLGMRNRESGIIGRSGSRIVKSVRLASGRFAIMQQGKGFALIPWRRAMQMQRTKGLEIVR